MKIAIGSDHGGFDMKEELKEFLKTKQIEVEDMGCFSKDPVDYPDIGAAVAVRVSEGYADQGVVICTTGIGMSIVANKYPRIRAALCVTPRMARMARTHNNANVLALGGELNTIDEAKAILKEWLQVDFSKSERHKRRVAKIHAYTCRSTDPVDMYDVDPEVYAVLRGEDKRQNENLTLIGSENYASRAVREAAGSRLTNKYAEGYPGQRWYNGCERVDDAERLAIDRAKNLFGAAHVNVQPHCGSSANMAVYFAMLEPGDKVLAMAPAHGGHLTHGLKVNFSGRLFDVVHYGVDRESEQIDYAEVANLAEKHRPKMIIAGASAYSRIIDFKQFRKIADSVSAYLLVDMAHIAGLVAAGCHPNPAQVADFVTSTTHKTLEGPRGGFVMCRQQYAQDIDKQVFPGLQGGPFMHIIAAKAVCFQQAMRAEYKERQEQVIRNAQTLCECLKNDGQRIVSGGTDNHLVLVDVSAIGLTGKQAADNLHAAGITVNKNLIPFDTKSPFLSSGIRIGTPSVTTRGMGEREMQTIGEWITRVLRGGGDASLAADIRVKVAALTAGFPIP